jgi:hypothetical protein
VAGAPGRNQPHTDQSRCGVLRLNEPQVGIEPTTARLRIECSTTELLWQRSRTPHALARIRTETPCGTTPSRWRVYQFHHQGEDLQLCPTTGATGLEPATSRVTVECSNQTELRPPTRPPWIPPRETRVDRPAPTPSHLPGRSHVDHHCRSYRARCACDLRSIKRHPTTPRRRHHSPNGSRTRLCTLKGCRPNR